MAKSRIELTCAECGCTFEHIHFSRNRTEANEYESWAENNITACPECYKKIKDANEASRAAEIIAELKIPAVITGVSDKQIAYAHKKRNRYVLVNCDNLRSVAEALTSAKNNDQDFLDYLAENNLTAEEAIHQIIDAEKTEHTILTATDAREILDALQ